MGLKAQPLTSEGRDSTRHGNEKGHFMANQRPFLSGRPHQPSQALPQIHDLFEAARVILGRSGHLRHPPRRQADARCPIPYWPNGTISFYSWSFPLLAVTFRQVINQFCGLSRAKVKLKSWHISVLVTAVPEESLPPRLPLAGIPACHQANHFCAHSRTPRIPTRTSATYLFHR